MEYGYEYEYETTERIMRSPMGVYQFRVCACVGACVTHTCECMNVCCATAPHPRAAL